DARFVGELVQDDGEQVDLAARRPARYRGQRLTCKLAVVAGRRIDEPPVSSGVAGQVNRASHRLADDAGWHVDDDEVDCDNVRELIVRKPHALVPCQRIGDDAVELIRSQAGDRRRRGCGGTRELEGRAAGARGTKLENDFSWAG